MRARLTLLAIAAVAAACAGSSDGPTSNGTAVLSMSPSSYTYLPTDIATTSAPYAFTVTNTGTAASGALNYGVDGANPGDFQFSGGTCSSAPLSAGASCTIGLVLEPQVHGIKSAALIVNATPGGSSTSTIGGTALAPAHFVIPNLMIFPNAPLGTFSQVTITVSNDGDHATAAFSPSITGTDASQFSIAGSGCFGPIAPGASCDYTLRFTPSTAGAKSAAFVITPVGGAAMQVSIGGIGL
jgi:hypothetical protein